MTVIDSSALLAFLQAEHGADLVEGALIEGGSCGAANWSEVAERVLAHGRDWTTTSALLRSYPLAIEPVTVADAEWAAHRWRRGEGLSLADRLCLALGARLRQPVLTADRAWGSSAGVQQIR